MNTLVTLAMDDDGVARITLDDPVGRNALSEPLIEQLLAHLQAVAADPRLKVVVLAGRQDVFCAGASRELLLRLADGGVSPTDILLSKPILDLPVPVIAAMEGHAIGGGLALGLCADILVIARESRYGASFMNMGFTPGMGITSLLEYVMSPAVAHELLYTGEARKGSAFADNTGFNHVLPKPEVLPKALDLAARIAEKSRVSLEALKRVLSQPKREAFERTRTSEPMMHKLTFSQADTARQIAENYVE